MKTLSLLSTMLGLAILANGCSTLNIDKAQVNATKKVAIIGFCVRQEVPPTLAGAFLGTNSTGNAGFSAETCSDKSHASTMYRDFAVNLKNDFGFTVLDQKAISDNAAYAAIHKKYTEGWQARPPSRGGQFQCYRAEGIVDPFAAGRLSMEERAELMRVLGVDRVAVAEVETHVANTNVLKGMVGAADFSTDATVRFQMYNATDSAAIWSDTNAKSDGSAGQVASVMGVHEQGALDQQAVTVSKSAYKSLTARAKQ